MSSKRKDFIAKHKISIAVITVILAISVVASIFIAVNHNNLYVKAVYWLTPKSVVSSTQNGDIEFHLELKENYSSQSAKNDPFSAFQYFYYDENGKRIDIDENGVYFDGKDEFPMRFVFGLKLAEKYSDVKSACVKVFWIIAAVAVVLSIFIWFMLWSKKQDEEKEKKYKNSQKKRRNK